MQVWVIQLIIAVVFLALSIIFAPKPKAPTPEAAKDLDRPTADASRPIPVLFGSKTVKSPNSLWYGDIGQIQYEIDA